jgi:hypothetical protein
MSGEVIEMQPKGTGPKMVLSRALKDSDNIESVVVLSISKNGEYSFDVSDMTNVDLCGYSFFLQMMASECMFTVDPEEDKKDI